jgi:hypothetical protein
MKLYALKCLITSNFKHADLRNRVKFVAGGMRTPTLGTLRVEVENEVGDTAQYTYELDLPHVMLMAVSGTAYYYDIRKAATAINGEKVADIANPDWRDAITQETPPELDRAKAIGRASKIDCITSMDYHDLTF